MRQRTSWIPVIPMVLLSYYSQASAATLSLADTGTDDAAITGNSQHIADSLNRNSVDGTTPLVDKFFAEQRMWLYLTPPDGNFVLEQSGGLVVFDPAKFPKSFSDGLVGSLEKECPVYPLTLIEDPARSVVSFRNADGKEIYAVKTTADHDPYWLLHEQYTDLYSGRFSQVMIDELVKAYSPSRVHLTIKLLPLAFVDQYAAAVAAEQLAAPKAAASKSAALSFGGFSPMMMYQGPAVTNLQFVAIEKMTNGMKLTLAYPSGFTNNVDFFTCSNLIGFWWNLAATTNVSFSDNWIEWTDTNAAAQTLRFYAAGDALQDTDEDGLADAREKYLYHTFATTNDTDGDGLSDYYEIITINTDPNNAKTNKPVASISYPANESRKVWIP